jgi:hypothetical protein
MSENDQPAKPPAPTPRKRYTTPRLEEYGHVSKLTQGGGSTKNEPGNPIKKACL